MMFLAKTIVVTSTDTTTLVIAAVGLGLAAISAVAACVALYYAREAVVETGNLRRDDRLAAVAAAISSYGTTLARFANGQAHLRVAELPVTKSTLQIAVATAGEDLPETRWLLTEVDGSSNPEVITAGTAAALEEVSELRQRVAR